ncbi:replication endonuclease [Pseudoalteromonas ruthenica]|uniref:replication endonuclease n=1 Tax=Pseudoalteromonas ruthenica TaxID=151081 RepID=UPI00241CD137|nr:replication endonuclease [Pseudoalteromonas ruthenica]|tara:strand:+ start:56486 stop:58972 length:2487 start_codon:yes stop_codon:yes gene_type:complete
MLANQPVDLAQLRLSSMARGIVAAIDDVDNFNYVARKLAVIPTPLQGRMARRYIDRYNQKKQGSIYRANRWLSRTIARLQPRFEVLFRITQSMPLPWHILSSVEKTKEYGTDAARECMQIAIDISDESQHLDYAEIATLIYEKLSKFSLERGVKAPFYSEQGDTMPTEHIEIALLKMQCEKWWARKLKSVRRQYIELLEIATGQVGKDLYHCPKSKKSKRRGINPYASKTAQREYSASQESGRQFLEMMELEGSDGRVISLMDAVKSGMANTDNRRNELMLRIRETEELAEEIGYQGVFSTITTPSRFHANSPKYQGTTPKDANAYLNKVWSRVRAKLDRLGINYFGVRVAEPHADATPHWHMLLFIPKDKVQWVNAIMRKYFIAEDREELIERYARKKELFTAYKKQRQAWGFKKSQGIKAKEPQKFHRTFSPRFEAILIDKKKGSAASYIAKYIAKNIDGYQISDHEDDETGELIKKQVNPVQAWASTWNIRQFQFQGSPSVTVWRELRRKREAVDDPQIEEVRAAADSGSWKDYVKLQGGMCIGRNARFKPFYEHTPFGNAYGELVSRIKGVLNTLSESVLMTRLVEWTRQLKGTAEKNQLKDNALVGSADLSWTSGNNCTPIAAGDSTQFAFNDFGFDKDQVKDHEKDLKAGRQIAIDGFIYRIRDGQLQVLDEQRAINERKRLDIEYHAHIFAQQDSEALPEESMIDPIAVLEDMTEEERQALGEGGSVVHYGRVYFMEAEELKSFAQTNLERVTPARPIKVTDIHWQRARELVNLAYAHANNAGRNTPTVGGVDSGSDYEYAHQVLAGETEQDWWDVAAAWG